MRMKQYKDDLMSSCLQLVLSLPNELVLCDIDVIIPALKVGIIDRTIQCTVDEVSLVQVSSCSNTGSIRDDPHRTSRENSL